MPCHAFLAAPVPVPCPYRSIPLRPRVLHVCCCSSLQSLDYRKHLVAASSTFELLLLLLLLCLLVCLCLNDRRLSNLPQPSFKVHFRLALRRAGAGRASQPAGEARPAWWGGVRVRLGW